ncbi:MAG: helix-turn-helix transcriptional regulator [Candidatus Binatia bacterium]
MKKSTPVREQLIALRRKRGLSQRQLAALLGVTQPVIVRFEREPRMSLRVAMRIAEVLGAEIRIELVERSRPPRLKKRAT